MFPTPPWPVIAGYALNWPLVIPLLNDSTPYFNKEDCNYMKPFKVLPTGFNASMCFLSPYKNNSLDMDVGLAKFTSCSHYINISEPICLGKGRVFACGDSMAYPFLPLNWTVSCVPAMLLPDVEIPQEINLFLCPVLIPFPSGIREPYPLFLFSLGSGYLEPLPLTQLA
jgi:hypothetical protein